jgi:hypothetical protein
MVALIFDHYSLAESFPESTNHKITLELANEMESLPTVSKN